MKNKLSVIVLSAGKGTRMKSNISKPLHKIGNLEMIKHIINSINALEAEEISVVVSTDNKDEIEKNANSNKVKTIIQYDRKGTSDAVKIGLKNIQNKDNLILITMGDTPLIRKETYRSMLNKMDEDFAITVLGFYTKNISNRYGRLVLNNNQELEKIIEFKDATEQERKNNLCNAGIYLVKGDLLEQFLDKVENNNASGEYYLTDIIEIAKKQGFKINYSLAEEEEVMGVNSRSELAIAENIFQNNKRKYFMDKGVTLIDPNSVYFSYDTEIEEDVVIESNVVFLPGVKIHNNVTVKSFSYLEGCEIKENAVIGPFARIRPESIIEKNAKIGNFCEIKKSIVDENTKINHLSYIGNASVGKNTNVGAGTITCNYNGYNKFKTKIGENSFIGSNTIIVAPIEIGNNVLIGAGSVITKNIENNAMAIARIEQKDIKDGMIKYREKKEVNN